MSETKMSDIIKASLDGIREFTDIDTVFGNALTTPSGVTVIPVSKVTVGFAGGGFDVNSKKLISSPGFGGGSGTGVSITPLAFLTVDSEARIQLIEIGARAGSTIDKALELISNAPEIAEKIKNTFSG